MKMNYTEDNVHHIMEVQKLDNPFEAIMSVLKDRNSLERIVILSPVKGPSWDKESHYHMVRNFFEIMGEENVNSWINNLIGFLEDSIEKNPSEEYPELKVNMDMFFPMFHKNLRQMDMFNGYRNTNAKDDDDNFYIDSNLDMLLYSFICISPAVYHTLEYVLVSEENRDKYRVVSRELEKEKETV